MRNCKKTLCFLLGVCLIFAGCSSKPKKIYKLGVDPTFYPLEIEKKQPNVYGFTMELLQKIGEKKRVSFTKVMRSWDNLLDGLETDSYEGALSSMQPFVFNEARYSFSDVYLQTGPVLVVAKDSDVESLKDLDGKQVAVQRYSRAANLLERHPQVLMRYYESIPKALDALVVGQYQAVVVPLIIAISYVKDLYHEQCKIVGEALLDQGIRVVTLKDEDEDLIEVFNEGLDALKDSGEYEKLLKKWSVGL